MTIIKNDVKLRPAATFEATLDSGKPLPAAKEPQNLPFTDEVCFELINPPKGKPRFYIARLHSETDLSAFKSGETVTLENEALFQEGGKPVSWNGKAKVVWKNDEADKAVYPLGEITGEWGNDTSSGWVSGNTPVTDYEFENLTTKLMEGPLRGKSKVTIQDMPLIEAYLKEQLKSKASLVYVMPRWNGDGTKVSFQIHAIPPLKELPVQVSFEGVGSLGEDKGFQDQFIKSVRKNFTIPITIESLREGIKKTEDEYAADKHYAIAPYFDKATKRTLPGIRTAFDATGKLTLNVNFLSIDDSRPKLKILDVSNKGLPDEKPQERTLQPDEMDRLLRAALSKAGVDEYNPDDEKTFLTSEQIKKYQEALGDYFGERGDYVAFYPATRAAKNTTFNLEVFKAPTQISFEGSVGPSPEELKAMFFEKGSYHLTNRSEIQGGQKLLKWYLDQGLLTPEYVAGLANLPPEMHPIQAAVQGDKLVVRLRINIPKVADISYTYADPAGKETKIDPTSMTEAQQKEFGEFYRKLLVEMPAEKGQPFSIGKLREFEARVAAKYPGMKVTCEKIEKGKDLALKVRFSPSDNPGVWTGSLSTQFSSGGFETLAWRLGGQHFLTNGNLVGYNAGQYLDSRNNILTASGHYLMTTINSSGSSVDVGASGTLPLGDSQIPLQLALSGFWSQPLGSPNSPLQLVGGMGLEYRQSLYKNDEVWLHPKIGLQYSAPDVFAKATVGLGFDAASGTTYGEVEAEARKSFRISEDGKTSIDLAARGGARFSSAPLPFSQQYSGLDMLLGVPGITSQRGEWHAGARVALMRDLATIPLLGLLRGGAAVTGDVIGSPDNVRAGAGGALELGDQVLTIGTNLLHGPTFAPAFAIGLSRKY